MQNTFARHNGEYAVSVWGDRYMIVEVLRWRDGEIEPGRGFWPQKADTERTSLVMLGASK